MDSTLLWVAGPNDSMGFIGGKVVCPHCAKAFASPDKLLTHATLSHNNAKVSFPPAAQVPDEFKVQCQKDGKVTTFLTKTEKSRHLRSCDGCNPKKRKPPAAASARLNLEASQARCRELEGDLGATREALRARDVKLAAWGAHLTRHKTEAVEAVNSKNRAVRQLQEMSGTLTSQREEIRTLAAKVEDLREVLGRVEGPEADAARAAAEASREIITLE